MTYSLTCAGCGKPFEAKSPRAKWCTPGCKKRIARGGTPVTGEKPPPDMGLVDALRAELVAANRLGTVDGQLALQLANRIVHADVTGITALSQELRRVRAEALAGVESPKPAGGAPTDDVEEARKRRDAKARKAAR